MKTAIYILMSIGVSLTFATITLISFVPATAKFELLQRAILSGLGFFGIGLIVTGIIAAVYLAYFPEK